MGDTPGSPPATPRSDRGASTDQDRLGATGEAIPPRSTSSRVAARSKRRSAAFRPQLLMVAMPCNASAVNPCTAPSPIVAEPCPRAVGARHEGDELDGDPTRLRGPMRWARQDRPRGDHEQSGVEQCVHDLTGEPRRASVRLSMRESRSPVPRRSSSTCGRETRCPKKPPVRWRSSRRCSTSVNRDRSTAAAAVARRARTPRLPGRRRLPSPCGYRRRPCGRRATARRGSRDGR